jgi:tetratricopeptide (TPR) repeat protein
VELAPQFSGAWNTLGTIAYQTRAFPRAEECFRRALEAEPGAFEPLVNLGGVLLTLLRLEEALRFNTYAVAARPNDALANSQLGMTYFYLGRLELARKHLKLARNRDPAHFSHPQLLLAEIDLREKNWKGAADNLEDFLHQHPDWPTREKVRAAIRSLRERKDR